MAVPAATPVAVGHVGCGSVAGVPPLVVSVRVVGHTPCCLSSDVRLVLLVGAVILTAGVAFATYVVELDAGDHMAVDDVWVDGERMHLMRDGVDLSVPRSRVHGVREVGGGTSSVPVDDPTSGTRGRGAQRR
jgi:hypothetical protein